MNLFVVRQQQGRLKIFFFLVYAESWSQLSVFFFMFEPVKIILVFSKNQTIRILNDKDLDWSIFEKNKIIVAD